jgi:hypothetical protein
VTRLHLASFLLALVGLASTVAWFLGVAPARPVILATTVAMWGALGLAELRRCV